MMQTTPASRCYDRYRVLSDALTVKYRALIVRAHPEVGHATAFHCAHNWGNPEAKALLARYQRVSGALTRRANREYLRLTVFER